MRLALVAAFLLTAYPASANSPVLSQLPRPTTLGACQIWAAKQDEDAHYMWGQQEDGSTSRAVALSRLTSACMGGERPEIVGFGSSAGLDDNYCRRHRGTGICSHTGADDAARAPVCTVSDPTPTPLNYRTAPYGRILGSFANGVRVSVIDTAADQRGQPWVYVSDADGRPLGWVYRSYVYCGDWRSAVIGAARPCPAPVPRCAPTWPSALRSRDRVFAAEQLGMPTPQPIVRGGAAR